MKQSLLLIGVLALAIPDASRASSTPVTTAGGIIVWTYIRPGNWLIFSDDDGVTWQGAVQVGETGAYNYLAKTSPDSFIVFHEVREAEDTRVLGSHFEAAKLTANP